MGFKIVVEKDTKDEFLCRITKTRGEIKHELVPENFPATCFVFQDKDEDVKMECKPSDGVCIRMQAKCESSNKTESPCGDSYFMTNWFYKRNGHIGPYSLHLQVLEPVGNLCHFQHLGSMLTADIETVKSVVDELKSISLIDVPTLDVLGRHEGVLNGINLSLWEQVHLHSDAELYKLIGEARQHIARLKPWSEIRSLFQTENLKERITEFLEYAKTQERKNDDCINEDLEDVMYI